jgi:hypothetical protein
VKGGVFRIYRWVTSALALAVLAAASACAGSDLSPTPTPKAPGGADILPAPTQAVRSTAAPEATQVVDPDLTLPGARPAVNERRLVVLEWPAAMRQDDSGIIRISLEMDEQGRITPTAVLGTGQEIRGEPVEIPNVYATHNVVAEARLDLAGVQAQPSSAIREPLRPGRSALFQWSIRASEPGRYRGTVWLHLHFIPLEEGQMEQQIPLTAQLISIEVVNFLGLGGAPVRLMGGIGAALGFGLSLDGLLPWLWKLLRRRWPYSPPPQPMKKG